MAVDTAASFGTRPWRGRSGPGVVYTPRATGTRGGHGTPLAIPTAMSAALASFSLPESCTVATRDDIRSRGLQAIEDLRRVGADAFVVEASHVRAFDATALGLLVLLEKRAREAGVRFVVHHPSPVMRAALRAAGLDDDLLSDGAPT